MRPAAIALIALLTTLTGQTAIAGSPATAPSEVPSRAWMTDLTGFLNTTPGDWIVGRSTAVALSAQEAETLARNDAASALIARLRPQLHRRVDDRELARQVHAALSRGTLVVDRQVISTERPYGTIWSAAVLVDASAGKVDRLIQEVQRSAMRERFRTAAGMTGAAVLAAAVGLSYIVLNWLTRGFFRGRLALASALIVAIGIIGIAGVL